VHCYWEAQECRFTWISTQYMASAWPKSLSQTPRLPFCATYTLKLQQVPIKLEATMLKGVSRGTHECSLRSVDAHHVAHDGVPLTVEEAPQEVPAHQVHNQVFARTRAALVRASRTVHQPVATIAKQRLTHSCKMQTVSLWRHGLQTTRGRVSGHAGA
jgi:hypothetical protein